MVANSCSYGRSIGTWVSFVYLFAREIGRVIKGDSMNIYHHPICVDIPRHEPIQHIYLGQKEEKYMFIIDDDADTEYMMNKQEETDK